jgi:hypothetical protein
MNEITRSRLKLIAARVEILLHHRDPWHSEAQKAIDEIVSEAQKASDEIRNDAGWRNGDR